MQNNNQNLNKNIRKTIPEPLMFIHTVSTPIMTSSSRRYYDSRDKKTRPVANYSIIPNRPIDELLFRKIQNLIQMYEKNYEIPCLIETKDNESIEGIPYRLEQEILLLKKEQETITIPLNKIKDVIILKI